MTKLEQAFDLFDSYNSKGPEILTWDQKQYPAEVFYASKLYQWVKRIEPAASEPLLLASRCQHIGRWEIPRKSYPEGRVGYLTWRSDLSKFHAKKAETLLLSIGYDPDIVKRVTEIVLKKKLKTDQEVQTIENALCLVFLEFQYDDLIEKHSNEKIIEILQKTWSKMTEPGRQAALTLTYSEIGKSLINKALA